VEEIRLVDWAFCIDDLVSNDATES
jgi:hypothetical protein